MLDRDLAALYGVELKAMNQAVKRNIGRFPSDFMFQLTDTEWTNQRSQIVTFSNDTRQCRVHRCVSTVNQGMVIIREQTAGSIANKAGASIDS